MSTATYERAVLLLGRKEQGKTSFVKILQELATSSEEPYEVRAPVEIGGYTPSVIVYRLTIPINAYCLFDPFTREKVDVPHDEKTFFYTIWEPTGVEVRPQTNNTKSDTIDLTLIDTFGLGDHEGHNIHVLCILLSLLSSAVHFPRDPLPLHLSAILLFVKWTDSFDSTCRAMFKHFETCMPDLFDAAAVVNTHFSYESWFKVFQEAEQNNTGARPMYVPSYQRSAKIRYMLRRHEAFFQTFQKSCQQFVINSDLQPKDPINKLLTKESAMELLQYIVSQEPIPLKDVRFTKLHQWQSKDLAMMPLWDSAIDSLFRKSSLLLSGISAARKAPEVAKAARLSILEELKILEREINDLNNTMQPQAKFNKAGQRISLPASHVGTHQLQVQQLTRLGRIKRMLERQLDDWSIMNDVCVAGAISDTNLHRQISRLDECIRLCTDYVSFLKSTDFALQDRAFFASLAEYVPLPFSEVQLDRMFEIAETLNGKEFKTTIIDAMKPWPPRHSHSEDRSARVEKISEEHPLPKSSAEQALPLRARPEALGSSGQKSPKLLNTTNAKPTTLTEPADSVKAVRAKTSPSMFPPHVNEA